MSSGTQGHQYSNHGSGSQSIASGNQNINAGSGSQYNADIINFNSAQDSDADLLKDLYVTDATADKIRIERTKGGILRDSYSWILGHPDFRRWQTDAGSTLLWVKGDPGKGKTMLLCGIIDELEKQKKEPVFFFCQATDGRINTANAVLRGLLYMLLKRRPSLLKHVYEEHKHAGKKLFEDANGWDSMCKILASMLAETDEQLDNIIFLIDGLDECTEGLEELLSFIVKLSFSRTKIIVSSRNWPSIEEAMEAAEQKVPIWLELNDDAISTAVLTYIHYKVDELAQKKKYDAALRDEVLEYLALNSNNTFLWVSLVSQQLGKVAKRHARTNLSKMPQDLNAFYDRMLSQMLESDDAVACKEILAVVLVAYRPVNLVELVSLTASLEEFTDDMDSLRDIIGQCGSLVTLGPKDDVVYIVHQSAKDFLAKHTVDAILPKGIGHQHRLLLSRSLETMSKTLRKNIYHLDSPGVLVEEITTPAPDPLEPVRYACLNWTKHAKDGDPSATESRQVYLFLATHYLHWLEAMSLLKSIYEGIDCVSQLKSIFQSSRVPLELHRLVDDALRFIRYHSVGISSAPLQAYSAVAFTPTQSIVRTLFREEPDLLLQKPIMDSEWDTCIHTLEPGGRVIFVAFSSDGTILASLVLHPAGKFIELSDVATGKCLRTIKSETPWSIGSPSFSPASNAIAVAYYNSSGKGPASKLRLLNLTTDRYTELAADNGEYFFGVRFSPNGEILASTSMDSLVRLRNAQTGKVVQTLSTPGYQSSINIAFSNNGSRVASGMADGHRIFVWDPKSSVPLPLRVIESSEIRSFVLSHDGAKVMSAHVDCTVKVWDVATGFCLKTIKLGHMNELCFRMSFSNDQKQLVSQRYDLATKLWDLATGHLIRILGRPSYGPGALEFSPDGTKLVSASDVIKIWDLTAVPPPTAPSWDQKRIESMAYSAEGNCLVSKSAGGIKLWNAETGQHLQTMRLPSEIGYDDLISVTFSGENVLAAVLNSRSRLSLWDMTNNACLQILDDEADGRGSSVAAFSDDSSLLAIGSAGWESVKIWDIPAGQWRPGLALNFTGWDLNYLHFSEVDSHLHLVCKGSGDPGPATISLTAPSEPLQIPGFSVQAGDAWIRKDGKRLLWLPPDYRTYVFATRGQSMALGLPSGRILFLRFA